MKTIGGRYIIESELGRGGMGVVFRGRDSKLERLVAIKLLHQRELSPDGVARFQSEALVQAKFFHPHIVTLLDFVTDNNDLAIVMEYIDGQTIEQLYQANPLGHTQAVELFRQVLRAVEYAHGRHVIHRDLKPSNIMVQKSGEELNAKVVDFGIAKLLGSQAPHTATGFGTIHYMSPEQINSPKLIDHRTDIYSLGVILYEILTGEVPFQGDTTYQRNQPNAFRIATPS